MKQRQATPILGWLLAVPAALFGFLLGLILWALVLARRGAVRAGHHVGRRFR